MEEKWSKNLQNLKETNYQF